MTIKEELDTLSIREIVTTKDDLSPYLVFIVSNGFLYKLQEMLEVVKESPEKIEKILAMKLYLTLGQDDDLYLSEEQKRANLLEYSINEYRQSNNPEIKAGQLGIIKELFALFHSRNKTIPYYEESLPVLHDSGVSDEEIAAIFLVPLKTITQNLIRHKIRNGEKLPDTADYEKILRFFYKKNVNLLEIAVESYLASPDNKTVRAENINLLFSKYQEHHIRQQPYDLEQPYSPELIKALSLENFNLYPKNILDGIKIYLNNKRARLQDKNYPKEYEEAAIKLELEKFSKVFEEKSAENEGHKIIIEERSLQEKIIDSTQTTNPPSGEITAPSINNTKRHLTERLD